MSGLLSIRFGSAEPLSSTVLHRDSLGVATRVCSVEMDNKSHGKRVSVTKWIASFVSLLLAVASLSRAAERRVSAPAHTPAVFPLKVSANKRYLVDQTGAPFLIVGDSPQGLMGRLTEKEAEFYFADREAHGFNTLGWIDVACAGRDYPTNTLATTPDGIRPFTAFLSGGSDFTYYDLSKPNEAYFVRLDHMIELAAAHHLAVFIDPIETIGWLPVLRRNGMDAAYAYGQFLGRRYAKYPNVLWISGNDFETWHASEDGALTRAAKDGVRSLAHTWRRRNDDDLVQAVARGIRSAAPWQLQTLELEPRSISSFDDATWKSLLDLNATYTYSPTYLQTLHSYNQTPTAPTFLVEAVYDSEKYGDYPDVGTPSVLRKQAYWTVLAGGGGQFYGNPYTWSFKDGWQQHLDTVQVTETAYWKSFFQSLPWQNLVPDQDHTVLVSGSGPDCQFQTPINQCDYAFAAKSSDGAAIVVYVPAVRTIKVNLAGLGKPARASWFDPTNETYLTIGSKSFPNTGVQEFTPPGKNHSGDSDWVLLLQTADQNPKKATKTSSR